MKRTLIQTNDKQLQGLHKTVHLLQKEHTHIFSRNQVLIRFFNSFEFRAVLIPSGIEFQMEVYKCISTLSSNMKWGALGKRGNMFRAAERFWRPGEKPKEELIKD